MVKVLCGTIDANKEPSFLRVYLFIYLRYSFNIYIIYFHFLFILLNALIIQMARINF